MITLKGIGGLSIMTQISSFDWIIEKTSLGRYRVQDAHGNIKYSVDNVADAVEWTNEQGGKTLLKAGLHITPRAIILSNGYYSLYGDGIGQTIIKLADSGDDNIIRIEGDAPYLTLAELELDGNKTNQSYGVDRDDRSGFFVPNTSSVDYLKLTNIKVHDVLSGAAIRIINSTHPTLINMIAINNGISGGTFPCDGIFIAQTEGATVINAHSENNTDTGLANDLNHDLTIIGGVFRNNDVQGVSAWNQSEDITRGYYSRSTTILGATIEGNTIGVHINKSDSTLPDIDRVTIIGARIVANGTQIVASDCAKLKVEGSIIGYNTSGTGISLQNNAVHITIAGNNITDLSTGIEINGAEAILISDNIVTAVTNFVNKVTTPSLYLETDNLSA